MSNDLFAHEWKAVEIDIPPFASEMPHHALTDYLSSATKPQPLPVGLPSAMPWDDELLPEELRDFVRDITDRTQCPPDFVAVALIVGISAVVGRKFSIYPKQHDDWQVVPNQWGCIIGRPSTMKSPAMKQALRPLINLEAREREKYKNAIAEHKAASEMLGLERKAAKGKAQKLLVDDKKDAALAALAEFASDLAEPLERRYIVNDATVEKLGELLNENPNGLLLARDELGGWLATMQTEDGAVGRAFYLECFDGSGSFVYDRIGRGTVFIESCCLSLIGGIQPSRIAPLVRGAVTGEMDDGLVQRLQLTVWPDDEREWLLVDRWPNKDARERIEAAIDRLDQTPDEPRQVMRFEPRAQELFNDWYTEHMLEIRHGDIHPALQSHLMKMPQTIAGLALLFSLIDGETGAVGLTPTARALDWADYLKSHANRLYGAAINASLMGAKLIQERKSKLPEPFTPRDVLRKGWAGLETLDAVNDSLALLAEHHIIIGYEVIGEKGGRPSKRYVWRRAA